MFFDLNILSNLDFRKKRHKIYWSDEYLPFTGVPFVLVGTKILDCHHGKDRNVKLKERNKKNHEVGWVRKQRFLCLMKNYS